VAENRWGYHRLVDAWAARVVAAAGVRPGELVLDIGAGNGALTARLVAAGARVIAVELHPGRLGMLRSRFAAAPVRVVRADAADLRLPRRPFRVVASPPYVVSSVLVRRLLARGSAMYAADLVLQRAFVSRALDAGSRGWTLRRGLLLPRGAFAPRPKVDSCVLVVRRPGGAGVDGRSLEGGAHGGG
jgi:23S rRNA (adenine-N6)-dimethyltransferase